MVQFHVRRKKKKKKKDYFSLRSTMQLAKENGQLVGIRRASGGALLITWRQNGVKLYDIADRKCTSSWTTTNASKKSTSGWTSAVLEHVALGRLYGIESDRFVCSWELSSGDWHTSVRKMCFDEPLHDLYVDDAVPDLLVVLMRSGSIAVCDAVDLRRRDDVAQQKKKNATNGRRSSRRRSREQEEDDDDDDEGDNKSNCQVVWATTASRGGRSDEILMLSVVRDDGDAGALSFNVDAVDSSCAVRRLTRHAIDVGDGERLLSCAFDRSTRALSLLWATADGKGAQLRVHRFGSWRQCVGADDDGALPEPSVTQVLDSVLLPSRAVAAKPRRRGRPRKRPLGGDGDSTPTTDERAPVLFDVGEGYVGLASVQRDASDSDNDDDDREGNRSVNVSLWNTEYGTSESVDTYSSSGWPRDALYVGLGNTVCVALDDAVLTSALQRQPRASLAASLGGLAPTTATAPASVQAAPVVPLRQLFDVVLRYDPTPPAAQLPFVGGLTDASVADRWAAKPLTSLEKRKRLAEKAKGKKKQRAASSGGGDGDDSDAGAKLADIDDEQRRVGVAVAAMLQGAPVREFERADRPQWFERAAELRGEEKRVVAWLNDTSASISADELDADIEAHLRLTLSTSRLTARNAARLGEQFVAAVINRCTHALMQLSASDGATAARFWAPISAFYGVCFLSSRMYPALLDAAMKSASGGIARVVSMLKVLGDISEPQLVAVLRYFLRGASSDAIMQYFGQRNQIASDDVVDDEDGDDEELSGRKNSAPPMARAQIAIVADQFGDDAAERMARGMLVDCVLVKPFLPLFAQQSMRASLTDSEVALIVDALIDHAGFHGSALESLDSRPPEARLEQPTFSRTLAWLSAIVDAYTPQLVLTDTFGDAVARLHRAIEAHVECCEELLFLNGAIATIIESQQLPKLHDVDYAIESILI
jgi:hypothetical protein